MLNEAIGNTNSSASNGFNSYDETLVEKNIKKQSRRRKSLEKGSKYFTVEEFVQNNSPFKLPRAKSSSNNSFEMLNPSNVIQKSLQRSHSISSNDSSFEQSIRSYLKESSGSLNTINNSIVDISNSQAVGHVNASNRELESLSPRKSVSGMADNSRQNNEQRNASGVGSMDTIAMPNSRVKIICMNQAPSDSSEGSKTHITLKDTSFDKGSGVRLHSGMQLDIAEVPKKHVNLNLSNDALGIEEKTILKHIGEETKESKDNVQSKRSFAGRLSTNDGLNEQLYDEYFKKIKSEFAEPPLMKNDSSQIAIDIPNIATMHESQTVDIVVDDTIKDLDGAISQSGQDAKAEIPIKMSRESIRKTRLKSFNTGLTPKKPSGTPSPKKSSVVSSTSHSEVEQVNDSHPEANYFCSVTNNTASHSGVLIADSSDSNGEPEIIYKDVKMKEKHTSSKKPSIRIPIKSSSPKSFEKLEYANSKSEIADNSKNSSFLDAFDSVNNDVDDDLETVNLAGETEPDIPIESSVKKVIENVRIKDTTLDNGLDDNTMNDTRVSDHSTLINDKRQANVSFEKKVENLPVKVVSSIENEVTQLQTANSPVNKSFSKNKKRKHFLVMPKKLKNLSKKPSKK